MNNIKWITLQANWIGYYEDVVSDEMCNKIIDYSDNVKQLQKSTYSTSTVNLTGVMNVLRWTMDGFAMESNTTMK